MRRIIAILSVAYAIILLPGSGSEALGQQPRAQKAPPTQKGTVAEVKKKGRLTVLMIQSEGGGAPFEVVVTPKIQFAVEAKGDLGFLRDRQYVSGTGTLTNKMLFVKNWTVHVGPLAKRTKPFVKEAPKRVGQSVNSYDLYGMVQSRQQDAKFEEYETLSLNIAQLRKAPVSVYIDKDATVTVSTTETDDIEEGTPVEYIQVPAAGGRYQVASLKVKLKEPLKSEEFFKQDESKSKSRRRTSSASK